MTVRSALFLPASNPRAIAKARGLACDAVILDLEDAVAPDAKEAARAAAIAAAREGGWSGRTLVVRANAAATRWGADDLAALRGAPVAAVLLPKVNAPADLHAARAALGEGIALWAMVETCAAVLALPALAAALRATGTAALVAGTNDLATDMRCRPGADRAPLVPALAQVVTAARAAGAMALDGVCNALGDAGRLAAECAQGAALGFDGKSLVHPAQIEAANAAFSPGVDRVDWARRVVAAFAAPAAAGKGAVRMDGEMVERLHLAEAQAVLARVDGEG